MADSPPRKARRRDPWIYAGRLLLLVTLYFLSGRLGLGLAHHQENATLIWPPTGLALASLILFGRSLWPGVFLGALLLNTYQGLAPPPALLIAAGNTLEAVAAALLLERVAHFRPTLERVRDVVSFLLLGALCAPILSATLGTVALATAGLLSPGESGIVWTIWWLGDMGGAIALTPLLLLSRHGSPTWSSLLRRTESWVVLGGLVAGAGLGFGGVLSPSWALFASFVPFAFLVWAGCRLGPRGAVLAAVLTCTIATLGTSSGAGPFVGKSAHMSLMLLWAYIVTMGTAALTLAAAIAERELAERQRDVEESTRRRLEHRMSQAQRLESLGVLAGGVAHDFNNILVAIRGNAELLGAKLGAARPEERGMLSQIEEAADRAAELCHNLLTYAGRKSPGKRTVLVQELVEETLDLLRPSLPSKVVVAPRVDEGTPPVLGDPTQLRQVLMNLVLNAAEAYDGGSGEVSVRTGSIELDASRLASMAHPTRAVPGRFVFVEVRDRGRGMEPDTLERIFDPFFTTKFAGRGLGLAAALGIVAGLGGAMEVESSRGAGTTFVIYLPASSGEPERDVPRPRVEVLAGEGRRVLLADDESAVRRVVRLTLERAGYEVHAVADGRAAISTFREREGRVDLVLLDVTMPEMSGDEVLRELKELAPAVPVVLMSGFEPPGSLAATPPDAFLRKPFTSDDLLRQLSRALLRRGQPGSPSAPAALRRSGAG